MSDPDEWMSAMGSPCARPDDGQDHDPVQRLSGWLGLAVGGPLVALIFDWQGGVIVIVGTLIGTGLAGLTQSWRGRFSSNSD